MDQNTEDNNEEILEDTNQPEEIPELKSDTERQVEEAKEEAQTNLAGWQRTAADFENYKKQQEIRHEAKLKDTLDFAKEVAIVKMLPTLDTLAQGLKHVPQGVDANWLKGINATLQNLEKVLAEMGVKKIDAQRGTPFDPNLHEAILQVPVTDEEEDMIVNEFQVGYELNGKVIRPSQVSITKKNA